MLRVLLIEDDADYQDVIAGMLQAEGMEVLPVEPRRALEAVRCERYDVVLTDVVMPGVSGTDVIREARRRNASTPVVAISGGARGLPADLALRLTDAAGAARALYKPFSRDELASAVHEAMRRAG